MLNFEQAKLELLYEKERLEIIIKAQMELLEIMKPMDKKMYNKKITDYISSNEKYRSYIGGGYNGERKELFIKIRNISEEMTAEEPKFRRYHEYDESLFNERKQDITDEEGKRFSYPKFRAKMLEDIARNRKSLAAVNTDLATGADRLREACMVMEYYKSIVRGFSGYIRSEHSSDFDVGYIG